MKLLYPKWLDIVPVVVNITQGLDENTGAPKVVHTFTGKCYYEERATTRYDKDGQKIQLVGALTTGCDIAPEHPVIEGSVTINGQVRKIASGSRPRNPDGTVNHTKLELM